MKKKRKKGPASATHTEESAALAKVPERLSSPFRDAMGSLKKELAEREKAEAEAKKARKAAPAPAQVLRARSKVQGSRELTDDDRTALSLAMQGVKPLGQAKANRVVEHTPRIESRTAQAAEIKESAEDAARRRLDSLVAAEVRFRIEREDDHVSGVRLDAPPRTLRELERRGRVHETLDLHGMSQREAQSAVTDFVRKAKRRGVEILCIVHGKGMHSENGVGVLRDAAITALTETSAATIVQAFVTAPSPLGGSGALLVELRK